MDTAYPSEAASPVGTRGLPGALVISLDFELHWGLRDIMGTDGPYRRNLLGVREAIPRILRSFERHGIAATWATVGFLFAKDRDELLAHAPTIRPKYVDKRLDPYGEAIGRDEVDDPFHFAASLVSRIADTKGQEVGSHTFSHYYCLEAGQGREHFEADVAAAGRLARERGIELRSMVLPRNQMNPEYVDVLAKAGFVAYRGNERHWAYEARAFGDESQLRRAVRLVDSLVPLTGSHVHGWDELGIRAGVVDIPASRFFRPLPVRPPGIRELGIRRVIASMEAAARSRGVFHLWWHPHNFGAETDARIADLERVLWAFRRCADEYGMLSLSMREAAGRALGASAHEAREP